MQTPLGKTGAMMMMKREPDQQQPSQGVMMRGGGGMAPFPGAYLTPAQFNNRLSNSGPGVPLYGGYFTQAGNGAPFLGYFGYYNAPFGGYGSMMRPAVASVRRYCQDNRHKTLICNAWRNGCCRRGDSCTYAHGEDDLQTVQLADESKFKIRLCERWMVGICDYGDRCTFAHGEHELRQPDTTTPKRLEGITTPQGGVMTIANPRDDVARFKTMVCKYWMAGHCPRGDNCTYAHGEHELRLPTGTTAPKRLEGITTPQGGVMTIAHPRDDVARFKTMVCKYWKAGNCTRGDNCIYAHGEHELRQCPISNQENYKRSICRYWMENGNCMRGDKCTYAHGNHELLRSFTPVPPARSTIKRPYTVPFGNTSFGPLPPKINYVPAAYYPQMPPQ